MLDLTEIACPNCLSPIELEHHKHGNTVRCQACHSNYLLEGHLCHHCHAYYKQEVDVCGQCGTHMMRICGKCKTSNWAGEEYCKSCGVSMDLISASIQRYHEESAQFREAKLKQVRELRAQQEVESAKRLAELDRMERERKARLLQREKEKQKQQWMLIIGFGFCLGVLGVGFLVLSLIL